MEHTLVAVFDSEAHAQDARNELLSCGIQRDDMHINAFQQGDLQEGSSYQAGRTAPEDESFGEKIKSFFANMFGSDDGEQSSLYQEAARRGNFILSVQVDDEQQMADATDILNRHKPINLEERAAEWRTSGWTPQTDYETGQGVAASSAAMSTPEAMETDAASRMTRANATAQSDAESLAGTVGDEQFRFGKRVVQRGGVRVVQRVTEALSPQREGVQSESELAPDDSEFRTHWQRSFSQAGGRYEDYAPAYRYGYSMHGSNQYRDRTWEEVEPQIRADWEAKNAGSPWEKTKEAVRVGWEKLVT